MDPLNAVILLALLATVAALGIGLGSMAHGGVFDALSATVTRRAQCVSVRRCGS